MPTYFGPNLLLLEKLASGGMGEVYRAKQVGSGGFEKIVAVKRILPHFAAMKEFEEMFQREMNICAQLQHPNIAQVFSNGRQDGYLYLIMEFINGKNTAELLSRAKTNNIRIPIEVICFLIAEAAKGLDFAHNLKDEVSGQSLNIIHRDVSPQNLMLSYSGEVKLVDFGIAKAADSTDFTKTGDLKGKVPYVSPEHIEGLKLDARSDIFSLGIVFYQLFSLESLFAGSTSFETMKNIREKTIPPLKTYEPNVPEELEKIVLKCLARNRDERYQTAGELYRDLVKFLNRSYPQFVGPDFASYLQNFFKDKIDYEKSLRRALSEQMLSEKSSENIWTQAAGLPGPQSDPAIHTIKAKTPFSSPRSAEHSSYPQISSNPEAQLAVQPNTFDRLSHLTLQFGRRKPIKWMLLVLVMSLLASPAYRFYESRRAIEPASVPSLAAHYVGDSARGDSGGVWTWADLSNAKLSASQTVAEMQPKVQDKVINGHAVLRFDGVNDFLVANQLAQTIRLARGLTVFVVARTTGYKKQFLWAVHAVNRGIDIARMGFVAGSRIQLKTNRFEGTGYDQSESVETDNFAIYTTALTSSQEILYQNGVVRIQKPIPSVLDFSDSNYFSIGQEWDDEGPSDFFSGDIAELIVFSERLSDERRLGIENYLADKYDIPVAR